MIPVEFNVMNFIQLGGEKLTNERCAGSIKSCIRFSGLLNTRKVHFLRITIIPIPTIGKF